MHSDTKVLTTWSVTALTKNGERISFTVQESTRREAYLTVFTRTSIASVVDIFPLFSSLAPPESSQ